jgi:hypothetical protein
MSPAYIVRNFPRKLTAHLFILEMKNQAIPDGKVTFAGFHRLQSGVVIFQGITARPQEIADV